MLLGSSDGRELGAIVGVRDGVPVGLLEGTKDGKFEGWVDRVGEFDGGFVVGIFVGVEVGNVLGNADGCPLGLADGASVGHASYQGYRIWPDQKVRRMVLPTAFRKINASCSVIGSSPLSVMGSHVCRSGLYPVRVVEIVRPAT